MSDSIIEKQRIFDNGVLEERARCAGIARRLGNEIQADLKKDPRGFRSSARMRAIAEMFIALGDLLEDERPDAVEHALEDLRKGFGYVAKKDAKGDIRAFLEAFTNAASDIAFTKAKALDRTRREIDQALGVKGRVLALASKKKR